MLSLSSLSPPSLLLLPVAVSCTLHLLSALPRLASARVAAPSATTLALQAEREVLVAAIAKLSRVNDFVEVSLKERSINKIDKQLAAVAEGATAAAAAAGASPFLTGATSLRSLLLVLYCLLVFWNRGRTVLSLPTAWLGPFPRLLLPSLALSKAGGGALPLGLLGWAWVTHVVVGGVVTSVLDVVAPKPKEEPWSVGKLMKMATGLAGKFGAGK